MHVLGKQDNKKINNGSFGDHNLLAQLILLFTCGFASFLIIKSPGKNIKRVILRIFSTKMCELCNIIILKCKSLVLSIFIFVLVFHRRVDFNQEGWNSYSSPFLLHT